MDDGDLESVPIHGFIAGTMVPMLKEKVQAIEERCRIINEARTKAYRAAERQMENEREKARVSFFVENSWQRAALKGRKAESMEVALIDDRCLRDKN